MSDEREEIFRTLGVVTHERNALRERVKELEGLLRQAPAAAQTEMAWDDWWGDVTAAFTPTAEPGDG